MNCVEECQLKQKFCKNSTCRYWLDYPEDLNCTFIVVEKNGALTLQEASKRLGVSHVRVKQIQDVALKKINKKIKNDNIY